MILVEKEIPRSQDGEQVKVLHGLYRGVVVVVDGVSDIW
jgi:hypothetical protein